MAGEKVVDDASVVVKWFISEEYSDYAKHLRDAYVNGLIDIVAPTLLLYEVLNALKYSTIYGEDELKEIAKILEDYQFTLYDLKGNYAYKTMEIAMRKGITIYDAAYVALALILGIDLYTADEKLVRKAHGLPHIKYISSFRIE